MSTSGAQRSEQAGSTAASSTATPRTGEPADGGRLPFTYKKMRGYKVRLNASAAYPTERRCAMYGKAPLAVSLGYCKGCYLISYCSRECQSRHWRTAHKEVCKEAKRMADLYGNTNPVKYAYGMMSEDEFYELQRRREAQIISEVARLPYPRVSFQVEMVRSSFMAIRLAVTMPPGAPISKPPAVEGARVFTGPHGVRVVHFFFRLARIAMHDPPAVDESLRSRYACVVSVLSRAIDDFVSKSVAMNPSLARRRAGAVAFDPFILARGSQNFFFWSNKAVPISFAGNTYLFTQRTLIHDLTFLHKPSAPELSADAVVEACWELFGVRPDVGRATAEPTYNRSQYICRNAWLANIAQCMEQYPLLRTRVDDLCRQEAGKSRLSLSTVSKRVMEMALEYTDIFRQHLLENLHSIGSNTLGGVSLATALNVSEQQIREARDELQALNLHYWPYHQVVRELLSQPPPEYYAPSDGRRLTLADGKKVSELEVMLSTQGLI
ncbi:unnamed protein product [Vitrella brassicaformis CCMP3155]|uniref:MYND-type domain-containing protein n=1 Tax=Vitrella brassicaformis (strain CCMP3155) TaxID=1169540 RepID=A0A0G4FDI1_VITBC|nr:unnamed protein product [Vitrella brassicaformis CCMP3155]|eukprot:CEM11284.1 unnamed protein product [Vitrella brassicaformis CCMP3155]